MTEDNGGFKLDGLPVSTYGVTLMYAPGQPMLPGTRDRTADVLNRAGQYWVDSELGTRSFSLPCQFYDCDSAADLDAKIRTFARLFVDETGRPKQLKLEFDDSPGWYCTVRYNGAIPFDRAWVGAIDFSLELLADDPYAYGTDEEYDYATLTTSGGSIEITSDGNVSTPAILCVENIGVSEITDGFTLRVQYEVD
jgi:phage-related protein